MKRQTVLIVFVLSVAWLALAFGQGEDAAAQEWRHSVKNDLLHDITFDEFTLDGKYLTPPARADKQAPRIVLNCSGGHFLKGYLVSRPLNN